MGMSIYNNLAAMSALHENNRNEKSLSKILKQAASGMKINSASDDASGYAISEKMRIKLRALGQNERNVKNGSSMLKVASGAIQEQTNLLKTIKQKVIDASNDTNNDHDREVIQKEIDQYYSQMSDIVYDTEFNGEKILMGNAVSEVVSSWEKKDIPTLADDSEIPGLLPDATEASLDGQQGPFATFGKSTDDVPYDGYNQKIESPANIWNKYSSSSNTNGDNLVGASTVKPDKAEPTIMEIDLSGYPFSANDKSALDNRSFSITIPWYNEPYYLKKTFILTTDTSKKNADYMIDINQCSSSDDVAKAILDSVDKDWDIKNVYDIKASGSKVTFETKEAGAVTANKDQYDVSEVGIDGRSEASKTGLLKDGSFTGGEDEVGHYETQPNPSDPDRPTRYWVTDKPASKATFNIPNITSVKAGAGITITDYQYGRANRDNPDKDKYNGEYRYKYNATQYLEFKDDDSTLTYDKASGHWTIGKNYKGTLYIPNDTQLPDGTIISCKGMKITMENGNFMAETYAAGKDEGKYSSITDGILKAEKIEPLTGINTVQKGKDGDGKYAHWDFDLSAYNTSNEDMVNDLINDYKGRTLEVPSVSIFGTDVATTYEFIDTGSSDAMDGLYKITYNTIDLNDVRNEVKNGKTVAEAFASVVSTRINNYEPTEIYGRPVTTFRAELIKSDGTSAPPPNTAGTTVTGLRINATKLGEAGNTQKVGSQTGELRHYTIDWQNWVDTQGIQDIPAALHEKGIRFYCPTDSSQWVNMRFVNGTNDLDADRPDSGDADNDIKTLTIDLSGVDSVKKLVETLDKQLGDYLENTYKHNLLVASDPENGKTTIYDQRRYRVLNNSNYDNQEKGAKIGTGIMDNVVKASRNIYVNDLVVQHTDKANMNIHVKIPQTSMDQIFGFKEGTRHISEYNVLTQDMREKLLGIPPDKGILDRGIDYLLDAQTSIGAQINHMYHADDNIVTQHENTTSAESVIRDADMAKTMMDYAKYNILSQGSQSMLAQANQTPQSVLSLLQ